MSRDSLPGAGGAPSRPALLLNYTLAFVVGLMGTVFVFLGAMGQAFYPGPDANIRNWLMLALVGLSPLAGLAVFRITLSGLTRRRRRPIFWLVGPVLVYGAIWLAILATNLGLAGERQAVVLVLPVLYLLGFALTLRGARARPGP